MADKNDKVTPEEVKTAIDELRGTVEKYGVDSSEFKEKSDKVEKTLAANEKSHQEIVAKNAEIEKKLLDQEERTKDLELEIAKGVAKVGINYKEMPEYKALKKYVQGGVENLDAEEHKTLRMDSGVSGGYLTTTEMDNMIIKKITEISPVRQIARVRSTSKKTLEIPKRESILVATYEGEAAAGSDSESTYGNEQITSYRLTTTVPYTLDLLGDSEFDLESEMSADVAEAFAFTEGNKHVLGTAVKQPEGFLINDDVATNFRETETSLTITGDDLLLLTGDLKVGYSPMYGFNRQTLAFLRTLKGSDGQYLWQAGLSPSVPNTIAGEPYIVIQDMPSIASGALSVVFADFLRGYVITDRTGTSIVRDEFAKKRQAIIEVTFHRWNTGQVVLPEAFKALKIKA